MSTKKQLPDNLKQLEQKPRFKQFYKQHTSEQLEEKLIEAGIEYGNDDNKAALTWRLMDANGMDFDNQANDKPVYHDEPAEETANNAINDVPTEQTPQADDSKAGNDNADSEQPSAGTEQAAAPSVNDDSVVSQSTKENTDHVEAKPQVSTNGDSALTGDGRGKKQPSAADQNKPAGKPAAAFIEVTNTGAYNFYETATGTMIKAKATAKIYTTATIDKAQILRNIEQYNHTRGNKLHVKK